MASHTDPAPIATVSHPFVQSEPNSSPPPTATAWNRRATSTSYELSDIPEADNDPHPRHPLSHSHSHSSSSDDLESTFTHNNNSDPYQLSSKLKSPSELNLIRANTSRKRDGFGPITTTKAATKAKNIHSFYADQNERIERWLLPVDEHVRLAKVFQGENKLKLRIAIYASFAANIILAILQIFAATYSGSLSLFTTMADAIFDPMSNVTLMICARAVKKVDPRRFPSGKARIETAGNIIFCFLMTTVSAVLIVLSSMEIAERNPAPRGCVPSPENSNCAPPMTKPFALVSVVIVVAAFFVKLCLFCYCWALRGAYSQVHILWEDHRNDMIINGIGALTSVGGSHLRWWIDPAGAIVLSLAIAILWLHTAYKEFLLLIGVTADTRMQQWITYISMTHSPSILAIDTVRAYHSGPRIIVEVDVVMDPNETLRATHDVAEELQTKLESLPDVERAYVHIDFETSHKPEHCLKKDL